MSDSANTEGFYLSQLARTATAKKYAYSQVRVYVAEDMLAWCKAWKRYCAEVRGTNESISTIISSAVISWWNRHRRKIVAGEGVKLPDWQCGVKNTEYALFTEPVLVLIPREVREQIQKAMRNGHVYANWRKATMAAVVRVAIEQHYRDNQKYILRYLKETSWNVDTP